LLTRGAVRKARNYSGLLHYAPANALDHASAHLSFSRMSQPLSPSPTPNVSTSPRKAVALLSGGLDSMLAVRVVQEQGIHVEAINFYTGFCVEGHTHAIRKKEGPPKRNNALWVAEQLGIKLHILDISEPYKEIVLRPKHGYGANLNPCWDCKVFMLQHAEAWRVKQGFDFIITGEVVGQRPMSQRVDTLPKIAVESGVEDRLVRPLCAQRLDLTLPEREGWVDRTRLHGFTGRSRKPQIALAKAYGFEDWAAPAGGCCFLTDASYTVKLRDLWKSRHKRDYELDDILLLKVGRHIRPRPHFKLIIAREEGESRFLQGYRKQFPSLEIPDHPGPLVLIDGSDLSEDDFELAARITARFGKARGLAVAPVELRMPGVTAVRVLSVPPLPENELPKHWYIQ
jgi:tRNA-specific 2-thiouridylase